MLKKGFILTILLIALQCLFISTADAAQTTINGEAADINSAVTWDMDHSPYVITDYVTVTSQGSLTIQPGVVVKFYSQKGLIVEGTLNAQGTMDKPIIFTDFRDDNAGGDTNIDGAATGPTPGYWSGIKVSGTATMDHCNVSYGGYYYDANIYKTGTEPLTLTHSTLSNSSKDGLLIGNSDGAAVVSVNACTIRDNKQYGIQIEDIERDSYTGSGNTFNNNGKAPICVDGGTLKHDITWGLEGSPYYITTDVAIDETAALTVSPGVVVKFAKDKALIIEGTLTAKGDSSKSATTGSNTIYFTDYRDDKAGGDTNSDNATTQPTAGWWGGIKISGGGTATMTDCVVRYTGYYYDSGIYKTGTGLLALTNSIISDSSKDGLRILNSDGAAVVSVNACTIRDNKQYGIHIEDIETDSYTGSGNSIIDNSKAPVCIDGGTLKHSITWNREGSPYYITSDVTVDDDAVLTVDPGVVVKFAEAKSLDVQGTLTAKGTSTKTIYFTSYKDDAAGGDTNDDSAASTPAPGWWEGIYLSASGTATLDNCVVRYGGRYYESNLYKTGIGALNLTNSELSNSSANGLKIIDDTGACTITKNKFHSNKVGIACEDSNPLIGGSSANANRIYQNTNFGVENKSDDISINAQYNWWGDATGPTHITNPLGKGDKVSDYVDFGNFVKADSDPNPTPVIVVLDPKTNVLPNKPWTIKFNQDIYDGTSPNSTVNNQNITVTDDQGRSLNITLSQGNDSRSIVIEAPAEGYVSGKTYTISIKNIKNVNNKIISKQYTMKFTIS